MIAFDRLDPLVQHHIVNTLGWRELRPLQEASINTILQGFHCLLLAPTAGGKTESAMFPLLSRMCSERWASPSIIYICPLKALINNLAERLDRYTSMLGRRAAIWHGDVSQTAREQARVEPPDVLLTTPESLEAMLISANPQMRAHFRNLRAVVVDEVHAFAGDDRGWHLLCVLERLAARAGNDIQRIGLSATVGNPEQLLKWLVGKSPGERVVIQSPANPGAEAEVTLDFVGSLENAANVILRLHQGEKRLIFCDSRSRVENLAGLLRSSGVNAFVSHSSLSAPERRRAEEAFARGDDCVIVATSTLELGIDVGDLDRVIQIDSPTKVASFLQRLGRTGRRPGKSRNCLFLCTSERALLQGAGLLRLWKEGYVEPIVPPANPYHIIAQQTLALCIEHSGTGRRDLVAQLKGLLPAGTIDETDVAAILDHLLAERLLAADDARYFVGEHGETVFGRRHFLELVSVFTSAPVLAVTDGRQDLGMVDQNLFFTPEPPEGRLLSLAGRGWRVERVDWKTRQVHVVSTESLGKTTWFGSFSGIPLATARAVRSVLVGDDTPPHWSSRARDRIQELRGQFSFLKAGHTTIVDQADGPLRWFTFGGEAINLALTEALCHYGVKTDRSNGFFVLLDPGEKRGPVLDAIGQLTAESVIRGLGSNDQAEKALKFSECLPPLMRTKEVVGRRCTVTDLESVLTEPRHVAAVTEVEVI